ncbi:hypothetical protein HDE76_004082 [Rhodanobacter sp. ANJX3]|uniref:glycosyltransferase family 2 protein n=1 Tax=unclassified Rhodanobacter TaxID=2621553 RepID=UPI0015CDD1FB|nr:MULTISPECIES: glycosyltransferase family 2 protein [unclassified Rhodanobacter]MBB5360834.1 hypothetical protein [Rhodanobacter sp. ANJX3]NYE30213.1 hypothetical protein [Rhodanobacter sp. K2T2]
MKKKIPINKVGHVRIHSVLYGNELDRILTTIRHLNRAADLAIGAGAVASVTLVYGDSSPTPTFSKDDIESIRAQSPALACVDYLFFDSNLGSAKGHNALLAYADEMTEAGTVTDHVLIMNPDVMLAPDALIELVRPFQDPLTGIVEARQLPIEHPKDYDKSTGETGWATTACALIRMDVLHKLSGFDSESFFLYCDDVDFSWRARLNGYKVIYQPSAAVFHDKRLGPQGQWAPTSSERYYSAEAALLMAYKYSRLDIVERLLKTFATSTESHLNKAAESYIQRKKDGRLPEAIDAAGKVAHFEGDFYTKHRFGL